MDHAQEEATAIKPQDNNQAPLQTDNTNPSVSTAEAEQQAPPNPRLISLQNKHTTLTATLADLQVQRRALISQTTLPSGLAMPSTWSEDEKAKHALADANAVIKDHIRLLHEYNEIKDIGQGLIGLVAEGRGVRVKDVMPDFGVGEKD